MPVDWAQQFQQQVQDADVRRQSFSDNYRTKRIQEYGKLGQEIQDLLSADQFPDKQTGTMQPLPPEEKKRLGTLLEHINARIQKFYDPKFDPFSERQGEDPLHRLTDKLHLTKAPAQPTDTKQGLSTAGQEFETQYGATPATAGAEGRQEKERNIEQFRTLGKKYGLPDQAIEQITERMIGGPGTIPKEKWKLVQGTLDGKPFTARMNEATGEVTDLGGNEVTGFQMAGKPPTSTEVNIEAYENSFDPPVKWAKMIPEQKAYFPEWVKKQSAAITTGQKVRVLIDQNNKIIPYVVQETSERQPGAAGGTPVPSGMRGKGGSEGGPSRKGATNAQPGKGNPSKGWGVPKAGVIGMGAPIATKATKDLLESRANYQLGIDRAKTMHRDLEAIKKKFKETGEVDQQAMLSILFNHIGMTSGAQKGTRITQTMIDEAQESAPWVSRLLARIGVGNALDDMALRGIVLTQDQMQDMVDLADRKVRILREHAVDAEKSGTPGPIPPELGGQGSDVDDIIKALKGGK